MEEIEAKLVEFESSLMAHAVLIQGNKATADYAKVRADTAVQTVTENKSELIEYTDDRIQELRDEILGRLTTLGDDLIGTIGGITDGKIGSNNDFMNQDWNQLTEEMRAEQREVLLRGPDGFEPKLSGQHSMATPGGLQPPTSALGKPCSMQLSYGATASLPKGGCRVREAPAVSRRFTGRAQRFRLVVKSR